MRKWSGKLNHLFQSISDFRAIPGKVSKEWTNTWNQMTEVSRNIIPRTWKGWKECVCQGTLHCGSLEWLRLSVPTSGHHAATQWLHRSLCSSLVCHPQPPEHVLIESFILFYNSLCWCEKESTHHIIDRLWWLIVVFLYALNTSRAFIPKQ